MEPEPAGRMSPEAIEEVEYFLDHYSWRDPHVPRTDAGMLLREEAKRMLNGYLALPAAYPDEAAQEFARRTRIAVVAAQATMKRTNDLAAERAAELKAREAFKEKQFAENMKIWLILGVIALGLFGLTHQHSNRDPDCYPDPTTPWMSC